MKTTLLVILTALTTGFAVTPLITPDLSMATNISVVFIILCATAGSAILSYGFKELKILRNNVLGLIKAPEVKPEVVITQISAIQKLSKQEDLDLAGKEHFHPFITDGVKHLKYLQNAQEIKETMNYDISERRNRHAHDLAKLTLIGKLPIQLGFVIALASAVPLFFENQVTPNLAQLFILPLITIINGFILSHFGIQPFTNRIHHAFNKDIEIRKMITRGIVLIGEEKFPHHIEHSLKVHVKPSQRTGHYEYQVELPEPPAVPAPIKLKVSKG